MLQPHEQRVVDELHELNVRMTKLYNFTVAKNSAFHDLNVLDRNLLLKQLRVMQKLAEVLDIRIKRFKHPNMDVGTIVAAWESQTLKDLLSFKKGDLLLFVKENDKYLPCYALVQAVAYTVIDSTDSQPWLRVCLNGTEYSYPATNFVAYSEAFKTHE